MSKLLIPDPCVIRFKYFDLDILPPEILVVPELPIRMRLYARPEQMQCEYESEFVLPLREMNVLDEPRAPLQLQFCKAAPALSSFARKKEQRKQARLRQKAMQASNGGGTKEKFDTERSLASSNTWRQRRVTKTPSDFVLNNVTIASRVSNASVSSTESNDADTKAHTRRTTLEKYSKSGGDSSPHKAHKSQSREDLFLKILKANVIRKDMVN